MTSQNGNDDSKAKTYVFSEAALNRLTYIDPRATSAEDEFRAFVANAFKLIGFTITPDDLTKQQKDAFNALKQYMVESPPEKGGDV